jgi:hypothetical protein
MPIKYDGKRLIPAPIFSVTRNFDTSGDGTIVGKTYQIQVNGKMLPYMGSPTSSGTFETSDLAYPPDENISSLNRLEASLTKQKAIRELFSAENIGKKFEIIPLDGTGATYFYPRTISLDFPEGIFHDDFNYSIVMTADAIYPDTDGTFNYRIENATESWSLEPDQEDFRNIFNYKVVHNISVKGKKFYNVSGILSDPIIEAKNWARSKMAHNNPSGISQIISGSIYNLSGMYGYNHIVSESTDTSDGSYSLNESWTYASGKAFEEFSVNVVKNLEGLTTVTIDGTVTGYEKRLLNTITENRLDNSSGYYKTVIKPVVHDRAQQYGGTSLNPIPLAITEGYNVNGVTNYSYEFDTRPTNLISGAKTESIVITYNDNSQKHAVIPVIGRLEGPVLQDLGTSDARTKSVNIDFVLGPPSGSVLDNLAFPYNKIASLVTLLNPVNDGATLVFAGQPQKTWDPYRGAASFSIEWTYE